MSAVVVRQSIEALYQEAEAVIHDGTPMLAIIKSFPPRDTVKAPALELVANADDDDSAPPVVSQADDPPEQSASHAAMWARMKELLDEAEAEDSRLSDSVPEPAGLPEADISEPATTAAGMPVPQETKADTAQEPEQAEVSAIIPVEPPAPGKIDGSETLSGDDLNNLVTEAKADLALQDPNTPEPVATAHLTEDANDIDEVMADIAAAVAVAPTAKRADVATGDATGDAATQAHQAPAPPETSATPETPIPEAADSTDSQQIIPVIWPPLSAIQCVRFSKKSLKR